MENHEKEENVKRAEEFKGQVLMEGWINRHTDRQTEKRARRSRRAHQRVRAHMMLIGSSFDHPEAILTSPDPGLLHGCGLLASDSKITIITVLF
ncbi:hypothetical protein PoB_005218300 [Plakobranchus ocellatus]|uniref:Uncharacterized protein n=1 Tax=Plakobranchus ocellatus TaxID=259542 RepID=A0AAV4C3V6_9GAST|nr:hypothetical protein PoB_005218300 [Plakobranchus ocellatus]